MLHFTMFEDMAARTVTTLHGRLDLKDLPPVYRRWPKFPLVSISDSQRVHLPFANWVSARSTTACRPTFRLVQPAAARRLPRLPRPHVAREGARQGDRDRQAPRHAAEDGRQGRCRRRAAISAKIEPLLDHPLIEFIGEIGDAQKPRSWAAPPRCCSRSTGPSRSAW
jgi:hypothetical protein